MRRTGVPRLHRLPQRLDYTLIPAPLDLSKPLVDEKAPLPAIIVTPSSPSHDGDFSIAFLLPPPKPTLFQRMSDAVSNIPRPRLPSKIKLPVTPAQIDFEQATTCKTRARATILLLLLLFIMACHVVMHQVASAHPHLEFGMIPDGDLAALGYPGHPDHFDSAGNVHDPDDEIHPTVGGWFDLNAIWAPLPSSDARRNPDFIVLEESEAEKP